MRLLSVSQSHMDQEENKVAEETTVSEPTVTEATEAEVVQEESETEGAV